MANGKLNRAQVGLALASALVVLLGSAVAISRFSGGDDESTAATGPSSTSTLPGLGQPGPATSSGPASGADTGGVAEQPAGMSGVAGSGESAMVHGVTRTGRKAAGGASTSDSSAAAADTSTDSSGPGPVAGPGGSGGGAGPGADRQEPPAPSQATPPDKPPLATAHASAGEGEQGAVVGVRLGNDEVAAADVTVGTNQLVGDHPPSEGTGVDFGGRLLGAPPSAPLLT